MNPTDITAQYIGPGAVSKIYAGMQEVWSSGGSPSFIGVVSADGWQASHLDIGAFSQGDSFTVQRNGFDSSGNATTVSDTVYAWARVREPYPDEGTLTTNTVALSEYIYSSDVISGSTNNSTLAYPKPQAMWGIADREVATGSSYTVDLFAAHRHARNGTPVAAVKFIATDESLNTYETTVSTLTKVDYSASGFSAAVYRGVVDLTGLTQGEMVTVDAVIYPHVGDAYQVSVDADTYPSQNLSTIQFLNDKSGTYGRAYAYVDSVSGNDGTAVVSETPATAQALPYQTIAAAANAIKTYNNANFSRNFADNGVIRLEEGTHVHSTYSAATTEKIPLFIEAVGSQAATIYQDAGASVTSGIPKQLKISGVTLQKNGGSIVFLDSGASGASDSILNIEDCDFDINGQTLYNGWLYRVGRLTMTGCTGDNVGQSELFGATNKQARAIGCFGAGFLGPITYSAIGVKDSACKITETTGNANAPAGIGKVFAFCQGWSSASAVSVSGVISDDGAAFVQTIFEKIGTQTQPLFYVSGDNVTDQAQNLNIIGVTAVGGRSNILYQDAGTAYVLKEGIFRNSLQDEFNSKSDTFITDPQGARVGNWGIRYRVSSSYNSNIRGASNADNYGHISWLGELAGIGENTGSDATPLITNFTDDRSFYGTNTGGGDYTLGATNSVTQIPAAKMAYNVDLYGNTAALDGTDHAGAVF